MISEEAEKLMIAINPRFADKDLDPVSQNHMKCYLLAELVIQIKNLNSNMKDYIKMRADLD